MNEGAAVGPMSPRKLPELSAFFPAFNERHNLERMVDQLRQTLPAVSDRYEIIIVDDGSRDGTGPLADQFAARYAEVRAVHHIRNLGYGAAIRTGLSACRYHAIFFTDGDCQFDVSQLPLLVARFGSHAIVTGYRCQRQDPPFRRWCSRGWTWLIRCLIGVRVRDLNCAFKLMAHSAIDGLMLRSTGAMINAELLALATRRGASIAEVPVNHYPRVHGRQTGGTPRVIVRAFWELARFVLRRPVPFPTARRAPAPSRIDRWIAVGLFAITLCFYLVRLGTPAVEQYDEVHHVKTARQFLAVREPTEWTHPHFGKLAMALSMHWLGDRPLAWRLPGAMVGSASIALLYLLGVTLGGRLMGAMAAGLLLCDGLQFVISRLAMLDVYVTGFALLAYLICARCFVFGWPPSRRAWLGLGIALGLALSSKWIAVSTYAAVLMWVLASWWQARRRGDRGPGIRGPEFLMRIVIFLGLVPTVLYLLSYVRYIQAGHSLADVWRLQRSMWIYHAQITEAHLYASPWWSWPLLLRPVWTYYHAVSDRMQGIVLLGNPAIFWIGMPCVVAAVWWAVRRRLVWVAFIISGFCAQYLPWGLSPRKLLFFHHVYSALPFICLALSAWLSWLWTGPKLRIIVVAYLALAVGLFWYFFPILSAVEISDEMFRSRMWFRRWI